MRKLLSLQINSAPKINEIKAPNTGLKYDRSRGRMSSAPLSNIHNKITFYLALLARLWFNEVN
jgi:hypothetical protein